MAKKVVATLQKGAGKEFTKIIRSIKTDKGSYTFKEEMVPNALVQETLNK